ncbi:class I SAM-dependent methyltransferase [bacterium]|nr:class I SAM-dependent methyltransferase [bacterium]MBU1152707.1 class I SAM-dependent methyltransferase [bacterium]MBU2599494.1 class I SAM-dependent methyltransferase [bacterium]
MSDVNSLEKELRSVKHYKNNRYRGMDQRIINSKELAIIKRIFSYLNKERRDYSLLDVPCGYGRFSPLLEKEWKFTSLDISLPMVLECKKSLSSASNQDFLVANIKKLPLKDSSYDCVLTIRLIQHVLEKAERIEIFKEINRVTRRYLILSFYKRSNIHLTFRRIESFFNRSRKKISMLLWKEFKDEVESCGFRVLKVFPVLKYLHASHIVLLEKLAV